MQKWPGLLCASCAQGIPTALTGTGIPSSSPKGSRGQGPTDHMRTTAL